MRTTNIVDENIKKIGELFPNCLTETLDENGHPQMAVDFDQLRQELSKNIVEGPEERYQFIWPDKRNAIRLANAPTTDTLRPCREESVDFDNTQNLYIEGDNLEVLKLLRQNYLGKIKMIYIDPPYNTGNDFVYNDDFAQAAGEYIHNSGQEDEEGNRLIANTESNGRFHTDWLNMIYPRLKVAKDLLSEDGVIFISIDDNENYNMRNVCNEVFGESNFIGCVSWHRNYASANDAKKFSNVIDYILVYSRSRNFVRNLLPRTEKQNHLYKYDSNDGKGRWRPDNLSVRTYSQSYDYPIINPNTGVSYNPPSGRCWMTNKETIAKWIEETRVFFGQDGKGAPQLKRYLNEVQNGVVPTTYWSYDDCGHNDEARKEIKELFEKPPFDSPKPTRLLQQVIRIGANKDSLVLDFFSGSATTAHAAMQLNAGDGGSRKFIMVQLPEATDEKSEAYKAGYKNICEIGKERIRRAGKKIKEESPLTTQDLDIGFRVLKLDSSNMRDVFYTPEAFTQQDLFEDNIKGDRTEEDLLFQVMIELGIELSAKIEKTSIAGKTVWSVNDGYLMACFDEGVNESTIKEVAQRKPFYFVMRDSSLATDNVADNFEQIWSEYSNDTVRKIL